MAYDMNGGGNAVYHRLTLEGREKLTVGGVEDVERFDESTIVLTTSLGVMTVTGEDLHIEKLSLDGGGLQVEGSIDAILYEEDRGARGGFFARLLR